jgi:hypothetical protein
MTYWYLYLASSLAWLLSLLYLLSLSVKPLSGAQSVRTRGKVDRNEG